MKPEFLESAEFYNRRYHNFSSRVIVPMSLLLVFLLGFAVFAEKEISLSTRATVEPSRIIANIQSTSNQRIVGNYLEENKLVKQGDLLAQLYPSLEKEGKTKLTAYLSSKDVARVKIGDSVRYTMTNDAKNQIFLNSRITSIDATATKTEKGNFFKIEAETYLTSEQATTLRYGLEGRLQMITGKKSYLRYFGDQFLNRG